jgi:rRNA maturation endonuclease Nob1
MIDHVIFEQIEKIKQIKQALELAREALSHTDTEVFSAQFELEEKALVAIDFLLEKL